LFSGRVIVLDLSTPFRRAAAGLIAAIACAFDAHAQDGGYDPSFGEAGRTWFGVTNTDEDQGKRMIQLPGGNLLMAGDCDSVACAAWLTQAGTLAAGSGIAGTGSALFSTFPGAPSDMRQLGDVAALADGRLVATSDREPTHSNKYFSIARFTEAGAFDSTFGIGGQSYGDMSTQAPNALDDRPRAMLIQNGGIIVGGSTYTISAGRFSAAKARIDLLLASDFE